MVLIETYGLQSLNYLPSAPLQIMLTNPWAKAVDPQPEHACELPGNPVKIQIPSLGAWGGA